MAAGWLLDKFCNKLTTPCSGTFCGLILLSDLLIFAGVRGRRQNFPDRLTPCPLCCFSLFSHRISVLIKVYHLILCLTWGGSIYLPKISPI